MKKISLLVFAFFLIASAGDWGYENVGGSSGYTFSFDTIEAVYTNTLDIANGKMIPEYTYLTYFITPDTSTASTGDSVAFQVGLDYSNDRANWFAYGYLDTVNITNTLVATEAVQTGTIQISPYAFRYIRFALKSLTVDTFTVKLQKSWEE